MRMKRTFAAVLTGVLCAGVMTGCGTSGAQSSSKTDSAVKMSDYDGKITLVIATKDEFLGTLDNAVKAAAEMNDVELTSVDCGADQDKQNDAAAALQAAINLASKQEVNMGISYELDDHTIWIPFEKVSADNVSKYY